VTEHHAAVDLDRMPGWTFVGRERELSELRAGLAAAVAGRGQLFLVTGEPGVGKTKLCEQLAAEAEAREMMVLWGRCWEEGGAPPYWPWTQAIRSFLRRVDPEAAIVNLRSVGQDLARIVPDISDLILDTRPAGRSLGKETGRFALFDAVASLLRWAAAAAPLAIVLDDLHAADVSSLLLLRFACLELRDTRVLFAGTHRDAAIPAVRRRADLLVELGREARRIPLRGLAPSEVALIVEQITGCRAPNRFVTELHRLTEGNPFFLNSVLRVLLAEGQLDAPDRVSTAALRVHEDVHEAVTRRLGSLLPWTLQILSVASVIGRHFDLDLVGRVMEQPPEEILEGLHGAIEVGVVQETLPALGRFGFVHTLIRETVYRTLPLGRRASLHARIADELEVLRDRDPDLPLSEIAHHRLEALPGGQIERAMSVARSAAVQSASRFAWEEAAGLLSRALEVAAGRSGVDDRVRLGMLLSLGEWSYKAADVASARRAYGEALELARVVGTAEDFARAVLGYAGLHETETPDGRRGPLLQEALARVPDGDSGLRARILSRLATEAARAGEPNRAVELGRDGLAMARRVGDPDALLFALRGWSTVLCQAIPERVEETFALADELVAVAQRHGDLEHLVSGHGWRANTFLQLGDLPGLEAELALFAPLAERLREPFQLASLGGWRAALAEIRGRLADAEELIRTPTADSGFGVEFDRLLSDTMLFPVRRAQGRLTEIEASIRRQAELYGEGRAILAVLLLEVGRPGEARGVYRSLAEDGFAPVAHSVGALCLLSELSLEFGDQRDAEHLRRLLLPTQGRYGLVLGDCPVGPVARFLGLLALTLRRPEEAVALLEEARDRQTRIGALRDVALISRDLGRALLARDAVGDRDRAVVLLEEAIGLSRDLEMERDAEISTGLLEGPAGARASQPTGVIRAVMRLEGEYWTVGFGGTAKRLGNSKGLRYLSHLIAYQGREFFVLDLVALGEGRDPGAMPSSGTEGSMNLTAEAADDILDARARRAYQRRIADLPEELEEAVAWNDRERAAKLRRELEALQDALAEAAGLGGRNRRAASAAERARSAVTKAITSAENRIGRYDPALRAHLEASVRTGRFCSYRPDPTVRIEWSL
jgi:tetratricopeptide (TPR) repeat protein